MQTKILVVDYLVMFSFTIVRSNHFSGGTITWKAMNTTSANHSTIPVMFTQSYEWRRSSSVFCNDSYIWNQSPLVPPSSGSLVCVTTPTSKCGGYTSMLSRGYCTDYSTILDCTSSQISITKNITVGSKFCVAFSGSNWVKLRVNCPITNASTTSTTAAPICYSTGGLWSVGTCVDLSLRIDNNIINTPPVATVISPLRVPINIITNIKIPVIDANGDFIRCRWATNTANLNECSNVCGQIVGSSLNESSCILTFNSTGRIVGDNYAITLTVEDFYSQSSTDPLSSVPLQFIITIVNTPTCPNKPVINSTLPSCKVIQVGIPFNFTLTITQGCPGTSIIDHFRMPPINMFKGPLTQVGSTNIWTITETWIPTDQQIGSQVYCAVATDSAYITSDQYCTTFTVIAAGETNICRTYSPDQELTISTTTSTTTDLYSVDHSTNKSKRDNLTMKLGIGIGIGIVLLTLLASLLLCKCCCCTKCLFPCLKSIRRCFKHDDRIEYEDQDREPNYHKQYIKTIETYQHSNLSTGTRQFVQYDRFTPSVISDGELNIKIPTFHSLYVNPLSIHSNSKPYH